MISKIRIYLKDLKEPFELIGSGTDEIGPWVIMVDFKADKTVHVKRKWAKSSQVLYTFPLNNLHYIDWGNCNNE